MKIAVNTRLMIRDKLEGIGWYTYEITRRLVESHPEDEFLFLFDRPYDPRFVFADNVKAFHIFPPTRHALLIAYWFQLALPAFLKSRKPDVFFSPDGFVPLRGNTPSVCVIHDLAHQVYPSYIPVSDRILYNRLLPASAASADRIVTVSEFSKDDLVRLFDLPTEKISVAYNAPRDVFKPSSAEDRGTAREKFTGGVPYFIHIGAIHPRKNLIRLLKAFDRFCRQSEDRTDLVIVGRKSWKTGAFDRQLKSMEYGERIRHIQYLDEKELARALGGSLALVSVSLYEGFGMPLVEAMACEVPVLAADASAYPEITGGAALLVDPRSENAITEGLLRISKDRTLRDSLIAKGKERRKIFDWDRAAETVYREIREAVGSRQ